MILDMEGDNLILKGDDIDFRKSADELVETQSKSKEMNFKAGFNHDYLISILNTMGGENLTLSQIGFNKLGFLRDDKNEGFETLWAIAPIALAEHKPKAKEEVAEA
jgi:hypothetical protein